MNKSAKNVNRFLLGKKLAVWIALSLPEVFSNVIQGQSPLAAHSETKARRQTVLIIPEDRGNETGRGLWVPTKGMAPTCYCPNCWKMTLSKGTKLGAEARQWSQRKKRSFGAKDCWQVHACVHAHVRACVWCPEDRKRERSGVSHPSLPWGLDAQHYINLGALQLGLKAQILQPTNREVLLGLLSLSVAWFILTPLWWRESCGESCCGERVIGPM